MSESASPAELRSLAERLAAEATAWNGIGTIKSTGKNQLAMREMLMSAAIACRALAIAKEAA